MAKRGRPPAVEAQKIVDALLKKSKEIIISEDGKISEKTNKVWKTVSSELKNLISAASLYSYVTDDRFGIKSKLFEQEGILPNVSLNDTNSTVEESLNISQASDTSTHENIKRSYKIFLTKEEFKAMIITKFRPGRRNKKPEKYKSFTPGIWEDVINDRLVETTKITCGLNFENHYINMDETTGSFNAYCNCGSRVRGIITNDSDNKKFVEIICTITKGSGKCGKRWLRGKRRADTITEMGTKTVHKYRTERANEKMSEGDLEPPNLPSSPVLRTARFECEKRKYADPDPVKALSIMKSNEARDIIRQIAFDEFFVHYWTPHQTNIYRDYVLQGTSCLCLDATGKVVKPIKHNDKGKPKPMYIYHGVVGLKGTQFPVVQMVSESHNTNTVHYWLMEWIRSGAPPPKEAVVDGGRAIITGAVKAFTNYPTIGDYADACFGPNLPSCYIRIDNAHFIKTYLDLFKNVPRRISSFYVAAIGQLIICRSVEEAKKIIRALLLVSQSETDGVLKNGTDTETEKARKYLTALITKDDADESMDSDNDAEDIISQKNDESPPDDDDEDHSDKDDSDSEKNQNPKRKKSKVGNKWSELGRELNEEVQLIKQKGDRTNPFLHAGFVKKFLIDLRDLPLWSCVVRDDFGFGRIPASSSSVESDFNIVKNLFLKDEVLPMRVDKYVHIFINYIQGRLKLTDAKLQAMETTTEVDGSQIEENNNTEEHEVEKHMVEEHDIEENVKFDSLTVSDEDSKNSSQAVSIDQNKACPACFNNEKPTGQHKCIICHRPVHNLDACSEPLKLTDEGFGQKRICFNCKNSDDTNIIIGMRHEENWRNQNLQLNSVQQTRRAKKSNASTNDEKVAKYYGAKAYKIKEDLQVSGKNKKITVLKNGSSDKLNPVNIEGKRIHCIYTCAFDTVYQILLAAICDRQHFNAQVEKQRENNEMYDLVLRTFEKGITAATYTNRAKFHYKFIKHSEQPDGSILLECVTTVEQIVMRMFANTPSVQITIKCNACSAIHVRDIIAPIVYMSDMQSDEIDLTKLDNLSMVTVCRSEGCKGQRRTSISSLGDMLILEVFDTETNMKRKLNSIPKYVKNSINSKQIYKLVGVADYTPPSLGTRRSSEQSIGHFTAICLRGTQWIEYDDRCDKEIHRKEKSLVYPRILMYVKLQ